MQTSQIILHLILTVHWISVDIYHLLFRNKVGQFSEKLTQITISLVS
jgi:hypothetical protein